MNTETASENKNTLERTRPARIYTPEVDIVELPESLVVYADMPGTTAEQINVDFENSRLTLHAHIEERQPAGLRYLLREYGCGDYQRTFEVGERIDTARISAAYKNGVLKLTLPKAESVKPKKVTVKAN
jgi:HSP20 family protein